MGAVGGSMLPSDLMYIVSVAWTGGMPDEIVKMPANSSSSVLTDTGLCPVRPYSPFLVMAKPGEGKS